MINNSIRARRTIAGLSVVLLGGAGLWLGAVAPASAAAAQTCHGLTATIVGTSGRRRAQRHLRPGRDRRPGRQ